MRSILNSFLMRSLVKELKILNQTMLRIADEVAPLYPTAEDQSSIYETDETEEVKEELLEQMRKLGLDE